MRELLEDGERGGTEGNEVKRGLATREEETKGRRRLTRDGLGTLAVVTLDSLLLRRTPDGASPDPPCPTGVEVEAAEFEAGVRPCETRRRPKERRSALSFPQIVPLWS